MSQQPGKRPPPFGGGPSARRMKTEQSEQKSVFEAKLATLSPVKAVSRSVIEKSWERPSVKVRLPTDPLALQVLDLDYVTEKNETVVRLFGATDDGNSISVFVKNYIPYFYALLPKEFRADQMETTRQRLNELAMQYAKSQMSSNDCQNVVPKIEQVEGQNIYGFRPVDEKQQFLKIYVMFPRVIGPFARSLNNGVVIGNRQMRFIPFEANIDFEVRFMVDIGLVGCGWVELPANKYTAQNHKCRVTNSQLEVNVDVNNLVVHAPEGDWSKVAPLRTLSFDIECAGRPGIFPEAQHDPVIQIANMVQIQGASEPFIRNCFVLGTCAPVVGSDIIQCATEQELLLKWSEFVRRVDPDILTGYNIQNFDLPYLLDRAKTLKIEAKFALLGRERNSQIRIRDGQMQSRQMGNRVNKLISMTGRVIFDVLQVVTRDYKLRSYTLNSVSYHFLNEQKEDVEPRTIATLQNSTDYSRRRLAVYCMKDAYLPLRLLDKLMSFINYMEMARVTGVPLNFLIFRGQQVKIISQLLRRTKIRQVYLPTLDSVSGEDTYEGATVIEPMRGFYNEPIATLDFASLYPSIMIAHNLCYSTLLLNNQHTDLKPEIDYTTTPTENRFVKTHHRRGVLPEILEDLLSARKRVKGELKNETDSFKKMVLNGRQLALKISANSVYGFTGATIGKLPCLEISKSVTSFGREMIELTKNTVEATFKANTLEDVESRDAVVIYGDTDSVMVKFGVKTVADAMKLGLYAAQTVSKKFIAPIKLEFEKVYFPYLLVNKKRYAGLYFTNAEKHDKMDCKGLETVRRDNCPLVGKVLNECLEKLMVDRDADAAFSFAKNVIADLLCNRVDISMLIISKELTRREDKYDSKQAHAELAERMRKRDPGSAPRLGDRVPYVIVAKGNNAPMYEKSEDPLYVLKNKIPIDTKYYLEKQLVKPLARIFDPIFGDKAENLLLNGAHTRTKASVSSKVGGLMQFVKQNVRCTRCRAVMNTNEGPNICQHCMPDRAQIYAEKLAQLKVTQRRFKNLWTECQNCAGTFQEEVLCTANDCPIFYMREKVRLDLQDHFEAVQRLQDL